MSIKSAPYYWIECDAEGCRSTSPDHEVSAWRDQDWALDEAADSEWAIEGWRDWPAGIGHWCPQHAPRWICPECGEARTVLDGPCANPECDWQGGDE